MVQTYWLIGGVLAGSLAVLTVVWFFFGTCPGEQPDYDKIRGWRDRKAEATSYFEMMDYRDSIEEELEKGRDETPYQRFAAGGGREPVRD